LPGSHANRALPFPIILAAVIFDLDGVLVDSFHVMRQAFASAYREIVGDGEPPFAEYRRHMGRYFPEIMRIMGLPAALEKPFIRVSTELAGQVTVYDGVRPMLRLLSDAGIRLAVATGKSGPRARALLARLDLLDAFDMVVGGDEVRRPKPAPDAVLRALRELDARPGAAVMVGDAPADMRSAHAAGVYAVAAMWGEATPGELLPAGPDAIACEPADVAAICLRGTANAALTRPGPAPAA
jgi:AHBA synthesis associated protein